VTTYHTSRQRDPYQVVVSEIMLQQTQVDRVIPKYLAWMQRWPRVEDLAHATLADVLRMWAGLGYNRRAKHLWLLAKEITDHYQGVWPSREAALRALPGIGQYTARAVLCFAFQQDTATVDTNIKRLLLRWGCSAQKPTEWFAVAQTWLPKDKSDPWQQLLMDFAATVCTAKHPRCEDCPVQRKCVAYARYLETGTPVAAQHSQRAKSPSTQLPFTRSNRFLRGKILAAVREHTIERGTLEAKLLHQHEWLDKDRLIQIVDALITEHMIAAEHRRYRTVLKLPD
jgi:A/G-specific adenine glycosylase